MCFKPNLSQQFSRINYDRRTHLYLGLRLMIDMNRFEKIAPTNYGVRRRGMPIGRHVSDVSIHHQRHTGDLNVAFQPWLHIGTR
jgi:hypothetical protein